jgi:hypothetical protein
MRTRLAAFHTGGFLSFSRLAVVGVVVLCMQAAACSGGGKIYRVLFQDPRLGEEGGLRVVKPFWSLSFHIFSSNSVSLPFCRCAQQNYSGTRI